MSGIFVVLEDRDGREIARISWEALAAGAAARRADPASR